MHLTGSQRPLPPHHALPTLPSQLPASSTPALSSLIKESVHNLLNGLGCSVLCLHLRNTPGSPFTSHLGDQPKPSVLHMPFPHTRGWSKLVALLGRLFNRDSLTDSNFTVFPTTQDTTGLETNCSLGGIPQQPLSQAKPKTPSTTHHHEL